MLPGQMFSLAGLQAQAGTHDQTGPQVMLHNLAGCWLCSTVGRGDWPGSLVRRGHQCTLQLCGAGSCALRSVELLSGLPSLGPQATFCIWAGSLAGFPAWDWLCLATRWGHRLGSKAAWGHCSGSLVRCGQRLQLSFLLLYFEEVLFGCLNSDGSFLIISYPLVILSKCV